MLRNPTFLSVLLNGEVLGRLCQSAPNRGVELHYDQSWLESDDVVPLSISMQPRVSPYVGKCVENWLWGLLPDDPATVNRMAKVAGVRPNDLFGLVAGFGEDLAGAVQFIEPHRLELFDHRNGVNWLSDIELRERIMLLRDQPGAAKPSERLALAGAQPKIALIHEEGRWGVPTCNAASNTIVKLAPSGYGAMVLNEHFCMRLANRLGLAAASTRVIEVGDVTALAVIRFDRQAYGSRWVRIHQEDMCQALGVHPSLRYENEGGPGVSDILGVLQQCSDAKADTDRFFRALVFNFLIGGTDAHAKNFSVFMKPNGRVELTPLYDVASMLPYIDRKRLKLSMKICGRYEVERMLPRHWCQLAEHLEIPSDPMDVLREYATVMPYLAETVADECRVELGQHAIFTDLVKGIRGICLRMTRLLDIPIIR